MMQCGREIVADIESRLTLLQHDPQTDSTSVRFSLLRPRIHKRFHATDCHGLSQSLFASYGSESDGIARNKIVWAVLLTNSSR